MNWLKLRTGVGGELLCSAGDRPFEEVELRPCFPLSNPGNFFSLIGRDGREIALVESPMGLDLESRKAFESAWKDSTFLLEVRAVFSIESVGDIFVWKIDSVQGQRTVQTRSGDWPRPIRDEGFLIEDISGDYYKIPPLKDFDLRSRRVLEPMMG